MSGLHTETLRHFAFAGRPATQGVSAMPATLDRRILLASGGLDSYIVWRLLGQPRILYVMLGHRYQGDEMNAISNLYPDVYYINLRPSLLGDREQPDGHIPYRNLYLALLGAMDYDTIYLGAVAGETSRDKSSRFFRETSRLLSFLEGHRVRVEAPYRQLTKSELVKRYLQEFPTVNDLSKLLITRSCYALDLSHALPCGQCQACFRRWVAMSLSGIEERYIANPAVFGWAQWRGLHWQHYLTQAPLREWPGIMRNNWQAYQALRKARR